MWQEGPEFLKNPVDECPTKSAKEVAADAKAGIDKLQGKSFTAVLTRAQAKRNQSGVPSDMAKPPKSAQVKSDHSSSCDHQLVLLCKESWTSRSSAA